METPRGVLKNPGAQATTDQRNQSLRSGTQTSGSRILIRLPGGQPRPKGCSHLQMWWRDLLSLSPRGVTLSTTHTPSSAHSLLQPTPGGHKHSLARANPQSGTHRHMLGPSVLNP